MSRGFGSSSLLHDFSRHLDGLQGRIQRPSTIAGWLPALKPDRASAGAYAWGSAPYTPRRLASASSTGAHVFDGATRRETQRRYRIATYPNRHRLTQTAGGSRPQQLDRVFPGPREHLATPVYYGRGSVSASAAFRRPRAISSGRPARDPMGLLRRQRTRRAAHPLLRNVFRWAGPRADHGR